MAAAMMFAYEMARRWKRGCGDAASTTRRLLGLAPDSSASSSLLRSLPFRLVTDTVRAGGWG